MKKRGLFIGRFQPFHLGHYHVIKQALNDVEELIIAVGSAQLSYTLTNPFTAGERLVMIRLAILNYNLPLNRFWIVPIEDINNNSLWVSYVKSLVPRFDIVYSNNSLVRTLFTDANYEVKQIPLVKRTEYSATYIRELMLNGKKWEHLVPPAVADYLKEINAVKRLKVLSQKDEPY
ncbi:MAG: nicotinamide-nucleotide adenylyltransferase [Candidatus Odinarchaeota archaeon]|nr:nicotinamide-nucleotide adenylyltransferase [Candidatus Odinarchaeota archaeon]